MYQFRYESSIYILCVGIAFLCNGGQFSMFPAITVKVFGLQNGGKICTFMSFATPASSNFGLFMVSAFQDSIGVENIFRFAGLCTVFAMILLYYFDEEPMVPNRKQKGVLSQENTPIMDQEKLETP